MKALLTTRILNIIPYLLIFVVILSNIFLYFTNQLSMDQFFNADALYLPSLYKDLMVNSGSYENWHLTPAPYFFPDMILYFLANFLTSHYYYAIPMFFTFQAIVLVVAIYHLYTLFMEKSIALNTAAITFSLIYILSTPVSEYQLVSAFHFGEFLIIIMSLYFGIKIIFFCENFVSKDSFYLLLLTILIIVSDRLFILHFILPFFFSVFILWTKILVNTRKTFMLAILFALGIFISSILEKIFIINKTSYSIKLDISKLTENANAIKSIFYDAYQNDFASFVIIVTVLIISIIIIIFNNRFEDSNIKISPSNKIILISLFLIFVWLGSLLVLLLFNLTVTSRYMIPVFLLPIIFLPIYFSYIKFIERNFIIKYVLTIFVSTLILITTISLIDKFFKNDLKANYYPRFNSCIDEFIKSTNSTTGISQYWQAKPTYLLSDNNITIAQVFDNLNYMNWISSKSWHNEYYDFALIDHKAPKPYKLNKERIILINGAPSDTVFCEDTEILFYKNKFTLMPMQKKDSYLEWEASSLPSKIGKKINSHVTIEQENIVGYITFGPYVALPKGKYQFHITYASKELDTIKVGKWDVVIALPNEAKLIDEGAIFGSNGIDNNIIKEFIVEKEFSNQKVEIRNFYNGIGGLTIKKLSITRID